MFPHRKLLRLLERERPIQEGKKLPLQIMLCTSQENVVEFWNGVDDDETTYGCVDVCDDDESEMTEIRAAHVVSYPGAL